MVNELSWVADYFLLNTKSALQEQRVHRRIKRIWDEKNFELEALHHTVVEEKHKNPIYNPIKGDRVDEALAEYLNSRDEVIIVPFIRKSPEVYFFGTKQVWLKFEGGKLSVRVGGGFLPIEDFIEAYSDVELEKFEYKNRSPSPEERRILAKFVTGVVGSDSPKSPERIRSEVTRAVEEGAFTTAYGVRRAESPTRGSSPSRTRATQSPSRRFVSP